MKRPFILPLTLAGVGLLATASARQDASKADLDKLAGKWEVKQYYVNGAIFKGKGLPAPWVVSGDKIVTQGGKGVEYTYKIDPTKTPKTIDLKTTKGEPLVGVYAIDGDTLKVGYNRKDVRPSTVDAKGADLYFEFRRAEP